MDIYCHKVQYYETDQMGVVHHSNYIRWFEEARVDFMNKTGYTYKDMENDGIVSPVVSVYCKYKSPAKFDNVVSIEIFVEEITPARLVIRYEIRNTENDVLCAIGQSTHCFLNSKGRPVSLKKVNPEYFELMQKVKKNFID